ncbi:MAG: sugar phosphate isomerase/epimerase [Clostridia bacterium]|nr:sugar phosphate isomerase/epimerase [Clostridia bacterium]
MKLGVLTNLLADRPLEEALAYFASLGLECVEIGCGGYPGNDHCHAQRLLQSPAEQKKFSDALQANGLTLAALAVHGNPVHPNKDIALRDRNSFEDAVLLAQKLGVETVVTFSGCPGDHEGALYPNWAICPWPDDYEKIRRWQWEEVLIPYWKEAAAFATQHGVRIALELHPGFSVYNPETLLRLREAAGDAIGANVDPSHLFWQGMDPCMAIRALRGAIHHFHAKDTRIDAANTTVNGVLDAKNFTRETERSWLFRTVGYGHDQQVWKDIISELRLAGYDGAISIEHEDSLMLPTEGLEKAVEFLRPCIMKQAKNTNAWWA